MHGSHDLSLLLTRTTPAFDPVGSVALFSSLLTLLITLATTLLHRAFPR